MKIHSSLIALIGSVVISSASFAQDLRVEFSVPEAWDGGYTGAIGIENLGTEAINGWELRFKGGAEISSLWNGEWSVDGDYDVVENLEWNGTIPPSGVLELGFGGIGVFTNDVADCTLNGVPVEVVYGEGTGGGDDGDGEDGTDPGPCPGDFNGDGVVDGADLGLMLAGWNAPGQADLNGDDNVDGADLGLLLAAWGECPGFGDARFVAYYIEWGIYGRNYHPADMPLEKITHVNYAFANIGADGRIAIGDPYAAVERLYPGDTWGQPYAGTYNQLNNVLRAKYPHIKTLISVGGWTWSARFSDVALSEDSRRIFAESCVEFIRTYNFDGVDVDWEYPVEGGLPGNTTRPEDGVNYTLLLQELRSQLEVAGEVDGREYLLTIASPAGFDKMRHLELAALSDVLDFINIMTYDFRGAWDMTATSHHSPLYANPADPGNAEIVEKYNTSWAVGEMLAEGVAPEKLVLGIPFYSRAWGGVADPNGNGGLYQPASIVPPGTWDDWSSGATGMNDFTEIEAMLAGGGYTRYWDDVAKAPYAYNPNAHGGHFVSYEDAESLGLKLDFVQGLGLGGVMIWEITADRNQTLIDQIQAGLQNQSP